MLESPKFNVRITGSHAVFFPLKYGEPFKDRGSDRVKVVARSGDQEVQFHAALQKRDHQWVITFSREKQIQLGLDKGDEFMLQLFEDITEYGVEAPEEFLAVLHTDPEAEELFEQLTAGRKRSLIYAILRFKNSQTKIDKSILLCENLKRGIRDPKELLKSF